MCLLFAGQPGATHQCVEGPLQDRRPLVLHVGRALKPFRPGRPAGTHPVVDSVRQCGQPGAHLHAVANPDRHHASSLPPVSAAVRLPFIVEHQKAISINGCNELNRVLLKHNLLSTGKTMLRFRPCIASQIRKEESPKDKTVKSCSTK